MKSEKVFRVQVTLDVYGQDSKRDVQEWLDEALHVDGLILVSKDKIGLSPESPTTADTQG